MDIIKLNKSDLVLVALFMAIAIPVTFSGYDYDKGLYEPIGDTIVYTIFTLMVTYISVYHLFPRYFPKKEIVKLFAATLLVMMVLGMLEIFYYLTIEYEVGDIDKAPNILRGLKNPEYYFAGISSSTQNAGILIGILLGKNFYEAQLAIQEKEKEIKSNELRLLKSQVDPHFLFNNLNSIDSLIDTKPQVAKAYLNKLALLYRYLIRTKDDEVVPLDEELDFAKNYIYLLEQRFGSAYAFSIDAASMTEDMLIPPGALQTLLENVVKHNIASQDQPINTTILIKEAEIIVSNNTKHKNTGKESFGVGLNNLKTRYKLLSEKDIAVIDGAQFTVTLPNLKAI